MSDDALPAGRRFEPERLEATREAVTMALYQSLSLLAVLLATPTQEEPGSNAHVATVVFLTGLGLMLAHTVAFRLSSRLVSQGVLTPESLQLLAAQARGALPIVIGAALPPLILGAPVGIWVSEGLLILLVALVGYRSVRPPLDRSRALVYVIRLAGVIALLMLLKTAVGH